MPGNKNSGRKRKASCERKTSLRKQRKIVSSQTSPQVSVLPGRTRHGAKLGFVTSTSASNASQPEKRPLQSARLASKGFEEVIGPSILHFPQHHLPQKRAILQRWKGLQIQSNFNKQVSTRDHARVIWTEIKAIWLASRIPLLQTAEKNFIDKIVYIITEYQNFKRTPEMRSTDGYQMKLNTLFDVSVGEDAVESMLRASRHKDWAEDHKFYLGQKQHPQLYSMGGIDLKLAVSEDRAAERRARETKRAEKEARRSANMTR